MDIIPVRGEPLHHRSNFHSPRSYYIVGNLLSTDHTSRSTGGGTPVVAAVTKTDNGWKCRSTVRGAVCHDYMSHESIGHVRHWIQQHDLHPNCLFTDRRADALERLAIRIGASDVHSVGFLAPNATLAQDEAAERVLQHLEHGW